MAIKKFDEFVDENASKKYNSDDALFEMASVGYFGGKDSNNFSVPQKLKVFVNGSEGPIPHFHIWDNATNGQKFHTCICINEVMYFSHNGKEDKLSQRQKQQLMEFLNATPQNKRYRTHWEYICSMWNDNNSTQPHVDEESVVPDYTLLK